MMFKILSQGMR
jgi:hypothetical protein